NGQRTRSRARLQSRSRVRERRGARSAGTSAGVLPERRCTVTVGGTRPEGGSVLRRRPRRGVGFRGGYFSPPASPADHGGRRGRTRTSAAGGHRGTEGEGRPARHRV